MLIELTVRNFAVIEHTRLDLGHALNVVTGETGAGKSLLVDAMEFVLGGVADGSLIRAGADAASVEAIFQVRQPNPLLSLALATAGISLDEEGVIVFFRETRREGRTVSRLNGRSVPVSVVREISVALVDIHGQGSHLSLLNPNFHRVMLDSHLSDMDLPSAVAQAVVAVRSLEAELDGLTADRRAAAQQKDLLIFQITEITEAGLVQGEEAVLVRERDELAHAHVIQKACSLAYEFLYGGPTNADDLIGQALHELRRALNSSGTVSAHIDALEESTARLSDAARDIRSYAEGINSDPAQLQYIEDRIEVVRRLKRKYGDTEEAVLAFAVEAQRMLEMHETSDERRQALAVQLASAREGAATIAWQLSRARYEAAARLSTAAKEHLIDVGMSQVGFTCEITQCEDDAGLLCLDARTYAFDATGIDHVEFLVETNRGEGLKPLARVVSGGETSRLMLALISALRSTTGVPTLVFDEIDSGIGARASDVVGRKLWALGGAAQVLCVTHLPQIAAYADRHFRVQKSMENERTFAGARVLDATARIDELAEMLGGVRDKNIERAARRMLETAEAVKAES